MAIMDNPKPKILLVYLSSELENFFVQEIAPFGYEVRAIAFKDWASARDATRWANAIFVQWDGRGQSGQNVLIELQKGASHSASYATIYAVTTSSIRIETLNNRLSQQLNIFRWFDLPKEAESLVSELALLIPDEFDHFDSDVGKCQLPFVNEIPFENFGGKHFVEFIKSAWEKRRIDAENVTKIKDEIRRRNITVFHINEVRVAEIRSLLAAVNFKCTQGFSDLISCTRSLRCSGADCLIVWCGDNSQDSETLLRMYTEVRSFSRIPLIVLYSSEAAVVEFKRRTSDLFIDQFVLFDRQREKFEALILAALGQAGSIQGPRKLLDDLRASSQDFPSNSSAVLNQFEAEEVCQAIAEDPSKKYWASVESLLAKVRFGNGSQAQSGLELEYGTFDALINDTSIRCSHSKEEAESATQYFVQQLMSLGDFNFERLVRASIVLTRAGYPESLKNLLNIWWKSKDRFPASFEFFWAASRYAQQKGFLALERAFLGLAIKLEPLRNEIVESYANHLLATGHTKQVYQLGEFLTRSRYFPIKKSQMILFNVLVKMDDKVGASLVLGQMIARSPNDRQLAKLKAKVGMA